MGMGFFLHSKLHSEETAASSSTAMLRDGRWLHQWWWNLVNQRTSKSHTSIRWNRIVEEKHVERQDRLARKGDIEWVRFKNMLPRCIPNYSILIKPHSSCLIVSSTVSGAMGFLRPLLIGYTMDNNGDLHHVKNRPYLGKLTSFKWGKKRILTVNEIIFFLNFCKIFGRI